MCEENEKDEKLMKILHDISAEHDRKTIIFVETKRRCDEIARSVNRRGFNAVAIHGDKSQNERDYTLNSFRSGRMNVQILVATDVASRGLGEYRIFLLDFPRFVIDEKNQFLSVRMSCGRDLSLPFLFLPNRTREKCSSLGLRSNQFLFICRIFSRFSWGKSNAI